MNRLCYYVAADRRHGPRPAVRIEHATRVYRSETTARREAEMAAEDHPAQRFDVGALADVPEWATEVLTLDGELLCPEAVPDDDDDVYTSRAGLPTEEGALPAGVRLTAWTRVPRELAEKFPRHPVSAHRYGEFTTSRRLTAAEMDSHRIEEAG